MMPTYKLGLGTQSNVSPPTFRHPLICEACFEDRAVVDLSEAVRLDPSDARALYHRGVAYYSIEITKDTVEVVRAFGISEHGRPILTRSTPDISSAVFAESIADSTWHTGPAHDAQTFTVLSSTPGDAVPAPGGAIIS
jgi:hypothetical protein